MYQKVDYLDEVSKCLATYKLPNVTQEKIEYLKLPITTKKTTHHQKPPNKEKTRKDQMDSLVNSTKHLKRT